MNDILVFLLHIGIYKIVEVLYHEIELLFAGWLIIVECYHMLLQPFIISGVFKGYWIFSLWPEMAHL